MAWLLCVTASAPLQLPVASQTRRHELTAIPMGMILDLTDDETAALLRELDDVIDRDRYFLSTPIQTLKAIRAKIRPEPERPPLPPVQMYAPPSDRREQAARVNFRTTATMYDDWLDFLRIAGVPNSIAKFGCRKRTRFPTVGEPVVSVHGRGGISGSVRSAGLRWS
jgi:hypothetical protein